MFKLIVVAGPDTGKPYYPAEAFSLLFGRGRQADCLLNDAAVSKMHCQVELKDGQVRITDLDSSGGTFVNGQKISDCVLKEGDIVQVGDTHLRLEVISDTVPPTIVQQAEKSISLPRGRMGELTGKNLANFQVGPLLAKGEHGMVFKATDLKNDKTVALKVFFPGFAQNDDEMGRFARAMKTMMLHTHPHLVSIHSSGKTGPYCFVAMEYIEGESLTQVIHRIGLAGMLHWKYALRVAYHIAKALEYAHGKHIVHRNITPQNILVQTVAGDPVGTGRGEERVVAKLGDLMLAKAKEDTLLTKPGEQLGDVRYMSPERSLDGRTLDERSDIYSLGATVYALLSGQPPCVGNSLAETIRKIREEVPVRPKQYQPGIPDVFEGAVMKMLAKRPEDRYQTAGELLKELEHVAKKAVLGE